MNRGTEAKCGTRKGGQTLFGFGYVALFLYVFLLRPAPEQILERTVAVDARPARLASLISHTGTEPVPLLTFCPVKTQLARWIAGEPFSPASLLTRWEQVRFRVEPQEDGAVVKAEVRWQVRGGLLGKVLDALLARSSHEEALAASLRSLKAAAEEGRVQRAALTDCGTLN